MCVYCVYPALPKSPEQIVLKGQKQVSFIFYRSRIRFYCYRLLPFALHEPGTRTTVFGSMTVQDK